MKMKKILISLFIVISALFATTVKAETTAPSSFMVKASDLHSLRGSELLGHGSTLHFAYKKNADGKIVYCIEIHDDMLTYGSEKYTLVSNSLGDPRFAYIMEHGYPNVSITGNSDKDYFITGLAIWYLIEPNDTTFFNFNFSKGTYKGYDSDVAKAIAKLVDGSKNASYATPKLKLNSSNSNLTLSSDGKYYVSSAIGVNSNNINGNKYSVSLDSAPKGTIITDTNGNVKSEFATNASFIVKVPVSSVNTKSLSFKVNVKAKGTVNKAYLYKPENSAYQSLTALYPENFDLSDSTSLNLTVNTKVVISKEDIANKGKELPGATLLVKDVNGKIIEQWVSTTEAHIIENLEPGKYTLTEIMAPDGYKLSEEVVTFEVKLDGTVTKVVMYNTLRDKVYISKQDITDKKELPGASLELKDADGNVVEAWVSGDTPHLIDELKPGKYTLTETISPEGYELSKETIEFEYSEDGKLYVDGKEVEMIVMYNKPEEIVEVPSTSSFKTITASLIGLFIIGLGSVILYRNYKKHEEK